MNKHYENYLMRKYPLLYPKETFRGGFAVGDGWFNIINALSAELCYKYTSAKHRYEYALNKNQSQVDIDTAKHEMIEAGKTHPRAVQVKEKFGGLCFYVDRTEDDHWQLIRFAECLSLKTCEECGKRGKLRKLGWLQSLCNKHALEYERKWNESSY